MKRVVALVLFCLCLILFFPAVSDAVYENNHPKMLSANVSVSVYSNETWTDIMRELKWEHAEGFFGDGYLLYGTDSYLQAFKNRIPSFAVTEDFRCRISVAPPYDHFTSQCKVYRIEENLMQTEEENLLRFDALHADEQSTTAFFSVSHAEHKEGEYLVDLGYNITHGEAYCVGAGIFILVVD